MSAGTRRTVLTAIGVVMVALGLVLVLRPLYRPGRPITTSPWLDVAFAAFFLFRGGWNLRVARKNALGARSSAETDVSG